MGIPKSFSYPPFPLTFKNAMFPLVYSSSVLELYLKREN